MKDNMESIETMIDDISIPDNVEASEPLKIYLKEIEQIPPLGAEEEKALGERIARGDMDARQRLEEANLSLVVSIASEYIGSRVQFMDLIQEGNIGLMQASAQYQGTEEVRFSEFAAPYIREEMKRAVEELGEEIKVPAFVAENMKKVQTTARNLRQESGKEPSASEIAAKLGDKTQEEVENILAMLKNPDFAENGFTDEEDPDSEDTEEERDAAEDAVASLIRKEEVEELLTHLSEQEKDIIRMRFGLNDGKAHTPEEVAEKLGIREEQVGQIEKQAMLKMREAGSKR